MRRCRRMAYIPPHVVLSAKALTRRQGAEETRWSMPARTARPWPTCLTTVRIGTNAAPPVAAMSRQGMTGPATSNVIKPFTKTC